MSERHQRHAFELTLSTLESSHGNTMWYHQRRTSPVRLPPNKRLQLMPNRSLHRSVVPFWWRAPCPSV